MQAASQLAVADPEEADANAVFAAIREYDALRAKGYTCEVALVAGQFDRGLEADQRVRQQVRELVSSTGAEGCMVVSDGAEDELVLPILQSIVPVVSVRRVVIKHSRSVEESYVVLGRYLRMLIYDPRYSRLALGVPGALVLIGSILILLFPYAVQQVALAVIGMIGLALIIRGFDVDKLVAMVPTLRPAAYVRIFTIFSSVVVVLVGIYQGFIVIAALPEYEVVLADPTLILRFGPLLFGQLVLEALPLAWIGLGLYFGGALLYHWVRGSVKAWRDVLGFVILGLAYLPLREVSLILIGQGSALTLVAALLIGLAITVLTVSAVFQHVRSRRRVGVGT
jgi:putative membrane protein